MTDSDPGSTTAYEVGDTGTIADPRQAPETTDTAGTSFSEQAASTDNTVDASRVEDIEQQFLQLNTELAAAVSILEKYGGEINNLQENIMAVREQTSNLREEMNDVNNHSARSPTVEELSEVLFRTIAMIGFAAIVLAGLTWAVLSPSPLIALLLIPAFFFVYAYKSGLDVVHG